MNIYKIILYCFISFCILLIIPPVLFNNLPIIEKQECDVGVTYKALADKAIMKDSFVEGDWLVYDQHFTDIIDRNDFIIRKNFFIVSSKDRCIFGYYLGLYLKYGLLFFMSHNDDGASFFESVLGEKIGDRKLLGSHSLDNSLTREMVGKEK